MDWLLKIDSVTVTYGAVPVLEDVSFTVNSNDFIGIIGPNGGGKTTLLKVILGLIEPVKGTVQFNNEILNGNSIGYLPQISTADANYPVTVTDIVLSGLMIRKGIFTRMTSSDRQRAAEVINELGLTEFAGRRINELSGGQVQRVFLARAIIGEPRLMLLDEPGNFVDSGFENDFYEKLRLLNHRMAILMVSHDIGTISAHIKSFACVNRHLHYHSSNEITNEELLAYGCPIQLITHGDVPHTVLKSHG